MKPILLIVLAMIAIASSQSIIDTAIAFARRQDGKRYTQAQCGPGISCCRSGPNCWDCSALVAASYAAGGITGLPATTRDYPNSKVYRVSSPQPGDIVWKSGHVQLYVSSTEICEAASTKSGVLCRPQWYHGSVVYYRVHGAGSPSTTESPDAKCKAIKGSCTSSCANGSVTRGLCPGSSTCCVQDSTPAPDARCKAISGSCTSSCYGGRVTYGLCPGSSTCCVPRDDDTVAQEIETRVEDFATQANAIVRRTTKIHVQLDKAIEKRTKCCARDSKCCERPLVHSCGKTYKAMMRRLARRTRALIRRIEYRKSERRQHARTRSLLKRLDFRIHRIVESL